MFRTTPSKDQPEVGIPVDDDEEVANLVQSRKSGKSMINTVRSLSTGFVRRNKTILMVSTAALVLFVGKVQAHSNFV